MHMAHAKWALPGDKDLLYDEGAPVENQVHSTLSWDDLVLPLRAYFKRTGFLAYVGSNSPVAYEPGKDALGPDVYVVNGGIERGQEGWVPWKEGGLAPSLIIEMLSPSTAARDRGEKMQIYRDVFKTPDYFLFESSTGGVEYYRLKHGIYVRTHADRRGRFRCASLPLSLGVVDSRLRWFERNGNLLPATTEVVEQAAYDHERAEREHERAEHERERAEREHERAEREHERAERERVQAMREHERAEKAEAENRRLQEELRRLKGSP
jgi:Uma2 family endonuclease